MKIRNVSSSVGLLLLLPVASMAASYHNLDGNPDGQYRIDPAHSGAYFTIGHVGITELTGRFNKISGTYRFDTQNPALDRVDISIPVASIDTDNQARDAILRSSKFFDAKKYPEIHFVSGSYHPTGAKTGLLTGKLSFHGVTHPVTFRVREIGAGDVPYLPKPWGGYLSGYVATTSIERSNYGLMAYLPQGLSNKIEIKVEIEGKRIGPA
ncbi:YceI family protein [Acidithiobacillus sp. AMEEHan]|uniref:YceI family protein n=1 Tax=Acidithiobacillus sp. AMEEHan TaxID=2994951 RepID=UPI0027E3C7E2|nr:YceI family protein [Acidithiobacillus sp. AMEEHan]